MKAIRIHEHGDIDKLVMEDVEDPKPKTGEVLVKIKAVALNHLDLFVRRGMEGMKLPLPMILGSDIAGEILEVGEGVSHEWVGKRVILNPGYSCGNCSFCWEGEISLCSKYGILGETRDGGYAELITVPVNQVLELPEGKTFIEGAAFPLVFLTSWRMLVKRGQIQPMEWVLILGGGAGVGVASIQIAKLFGAKVIA
ncbi:MAG: alcohol dehydrogenase, partial [Planctomycetota bacterium]